MSIVDWPVNAAQANRGAGLAGAAIQDGHSPPAAEPTAPAFTQMTMALPWVGLGLLLLFTVAAFDVVKSDSEKLALERFEVRKAEIINAIDERMVAYTQALRSGLALFKASERVSRDEWRAYVETLSINELYPGIQGIGFSEWVLPENRVVYEAAIRAEGFDGFTIRPGGERAIYSSIIYLEPFDERNRQAFGYDMFSQETRRRAMELARDTGEVAISGKVTLVQEISDDVQAGFLMYLPYYGREATPSTLAARRSASVGFVYSPFRMRNLMEGILGPGLPNVRLEIYDGETIGDDALMYDSQTNESERSPLFAETHRMEIGQHIWTLRVSTLPGFEKVLDPQKSYIVLFAGIFISLLFFGVVWSFARTRQRAHKLAEAMTLALNKHSQELARSNEDLEQFAYVASHDLKAPLRGIDNLVSWVEEDLGDRLQGEARENMQLVRGRVRRLENLLNDLLNYSRARRVESPVEPTDLEELISTSWKLLNSGNRLKLVLNLELESKTANIRVSALEQVLTNLFSNAIKHHDKETGTIFVTVSEQPECYIFLVADDGPGIPVDQRERAFQMFQTLRPRDEVEGSGMGLAIIRKLIERIGGSITIEGRPGGRGVQFRFTWPKIPGAVTTSDFAA